MRKGWREGVDGGRLALRLETTMEAMKIIWVRGDEGKRADGKDVQNITSVGRAHSLGVVVRERTGMAVWPEERHGEERRNGWSAS